MVEIQLAIGKLRDLVHVVTYNTEFHVSIGYLQPDDVLCSTMHQRQLLHPISIKGKLLF
jgi:hypothetical protein